MDSPVSAYVHIPFCRHRCFYCDFPISVVGPKQRGETSLGMASYVDWLCQEITVTPALGPPLETIFFGGGTPSLLSLAQLEQILSTLKRHIGIAAQAEISIEMDPGTFGLEQLTGFLAAGINRISLGVQALDDRLLEACGRSHRLADVYQTIEWLQQLKVPSWSLDLISGLPHQTLQQWQQGLQTAVGLAPHHLSIYDLTIEPKTVFARRYQPGAAPLPSDDQTTAMYREAQRYLTSQGYEHYEISNYAQPGHRCHHNLTYWQNRAYYGFGMGATSYTNRQRCSRPRTLQGYRSWLDQLIVDRGQLPIAPTSPEEQLIDSLMVGLRLRDGLSSQNLRTLCSADTWHRLYSQLQPHIQAGRVVLEPGVGSQGSAGAHRVPPLEASWRLRLSDPEGFLMSNQVLVDCFQIFPEFVA